MKSYLTFRRHPLGEVVGRTNEDRHPLEVVPYGKFSAGVWTGHPIGFVVVLGILIMGLVSIPAWRCFFGATVIVGSVIGFFFGVTTNQSKSHDASGCTPRPWR